MYTVTYIIKLLFAVVEVDIVAAAAVVEVAVVSVGMVLVEEYYVVVANVE